MPSKSASQHRLMAAVAHNPDFADKVGIPSKVGRHYLAADKGKKLKSGGLYENINAKRERIAQGSGEKMRSVGESGAPTAKAFRESAKTVKMKEGGPSLSIKRGEKLPASQGAGLTEKGRERYNRATGSHLQAPQPQGGPRKDSFCARMRGNPGPMKDEKGRPTRKAAALARWKC